MANQQMIDSWERGQANYTQARYFTPVRQRTQYRIIETSEHAQASEMDLLVVVHNDVPATDVGLQRVDLIVNSGRYDRAAMHANGHLVNSYDEQAGITDHTALYSDQDMARIRQGAGPPIRVPDRHGAGPPGAEIYSVWAKLKTNARGQLVTDTAQPIHPGSGADRYSLHDVQEGMVKAALREAGDRPAHGPSSAPRPYATPTHATPTHATPGQFAAGRAVAYTPEQLAAIRATSGRPTPATPATPVAPVYRASSQAGLAAASGPQRSVPSSPAPGRPGSRFNPNIRERQPRPSAAPGRVSAAPSGIKNGAIENSPAEAETMRAEAASTARAHKSDPSNKGVVATSANGTANGTAKDAVVGLVRGLHTEMAGHQTEATPLRATEQPKDSPSPGKDLIGRMGSVFGRGPDLNATQQPATSQPATPRPAGPPVSERYDYQFESNDQAKDPAKDQAKDQASGIEQQHSA